MSLGMIIEKGLLLNDFIHFLNQTHAGCRLALTWFLKIDLVRTSVCVRVCMCVSALRLLLITSGMM